MTGEAGEPAAEIAAGSPRVAVIIPCFNDGELAREAVASVREREPVTIVVIDDSSTDSASLQALAGIDAQPGVRLITHESNLGLSAARMTGVRATATPYVFPLDADDLAIEGALATMADRLDATTEAAVCFGDYLEFGDHELLRAVPDRLDPFRVAYTNEYPPSALFRRDALMAAGGWTLTGHGYEDWDLWLTLAEQGRTGIHAGVGVPTYRRRLHGRRMLYTVKRRHVEYYRILRSRHPRLFGEISVHRRASDMSLVRKLAYPVVYGSRPRHRFEPWIKAVLDRTRLWTLRR